MLAQLKQDRESFAVDSANDSTTRSSEVFSAMSYALDLTGGYAENHAVRSAIIGQHLAAHLGLSSSARGTLFYASLLKDLGCSSNSARMCALFQADDRQIKHSIRLIDWTNQFSAARYFLAKAKPGGSVRERLKAIVGIAANKDELSRGLIEVRCARGAAITSMLGFPEETAHSIYALDEHWDGNGQPQGLKGSDIPLEARICSLAQTVEIFIAELGIDATCEVARQRSGTWFDPQLVSTFLTIAKDSDFVAAMAHQNPRALLQSLEPEDQVRWIDEDKYDRVALAFSQVIDAKSPWTFLHSEGVAHISAGIAKTLGMPAVDQNEIHRAGLLHDIGKLGVSNLVLDKAGKLTDEEFAEIRTHAAHTQKILGRIAIFERMSDYASAHHERLDGKGYHRALEGDQIPLEARILAVADVCEALSADRPYRDGMSPEKVLSIISGDSGTAFCPEVVEAFMQYQDDSNLFEHLKNRTIVRPPQSI